jgi:hypothetical protein
VSSLVSMLIREGADTRLDVNGSLGVTFSLNHRPGFFVCRQSSNTQNAVTARDGA